jgi:hypothetical protein
MVYVCLPMSEVRAMDGFATQNHASQIQGDGLL